MRDYHSLEEHLSGALQLRRRPVAVSFRETPPATVAAFAGNRAGGLRFLAARRRRKDLLYDSQRSLQLCNWKLHAFHQFAT